MYAAATERKCLCLQLPLLGLLRPREVRRSKEFHSLGIPRIPQTSALPKKKSHKTTQHFLYHITIYYLCLLWSCGVNFTQWSLRTSVRVPAPTNTSVDIFSWSVHRYVNCKGNKISETYIVTKQILTPSRMQRTRTSLWNSPQYLTEQSIFEGSQASSVRLSSKRT